MSADPVRPGKRLSTAVPAGIAATLAFIR